MPQKMTSEALAYFKKSATLRQIEVVCLVAQIGSISETAQLLQISTAAVTRIVQRFETHFQFPIFLKKRYGITLSTEGEDLLNILQEIKNSIDSAATRLVAR